LVDGPRAAPAQSNFQLPRNLDNGAARHYGRLKADPGTSHMALVPVPFWNISPLWLVIRCSKTGPRDLQPSQAEPRNAALISRNALVSLCILPRLHQYPSWQPHLLDRLYPLGAASNYCQHALYRFLAITGTVTFFFRWTYICMGKCSALNLLLAASCSVRLHTSCMPLQATGLTARVCPLPECVITSSWKTLSYERPAIHMTLASMLYRFRAIELSHLPAPRVVNLIYCYPLPLRCGHMYAV
jgi:hypothetical protein